MTYTAEQLAEILDKHAKWLGGKEGGSRANLAGANLEGANLAGAYLAGASLAGANLVGANLAGANLADANLVGANLAGANLADADLADANLAGANLVRVHLAGANLAGANLMWAHLADADLEDADLADAYLAGAFAAHNKHVITACLTNYQMALFQHKGAVLVTAGCRRGLTIEQARAHWAQGNEEKWSERTVAYGARQRAMLEFLVCEAAGLGWPVNVAGKDNEVQS